MHVRVVPALIFTASILLNIILAGGMYYLYLQVQGRQVSPVPETEITELPLQKYSYPNLKEATYLPETITFGPIQDEQDSYVTRLFTYEVEGLTVSGIAHFPVEAGDFPVIIMVRGYVDKEMYTPGMGSNPAARYFAQNGFITLAPDRLGYGTSDEAPDVEFADRLLSYPTVLQLLANVNDLNTSLDQVGSFAHADQERIGMWAHSNGGQIALSVLELSRQEIPTVLWAPVSKPFPYSVLYYTDESDDHGKFIRSAIAEFEGEYDVERYSLTNYLDWIDSPIQLYQGGSDDEVPIEWSDELHETLTTLEKDIEYFTYPYADHNMVPDWEKAAQSSLRFFEKHLSQ
ncbi:MAG: prolyl oligopeptidase family serine peptidase [Candidatus Roizmanbacteria bacterium]|nr:prolyl oligopeptidase family serine peptidase [Candidatus Roizmanbacteria bacterium]